MASIQSTDNHQCDLSSSLTEPRQFTDELDETEISTYNSRRSARIRARKVAHNATLTVSDGSRVYHIRHLDLDLIRRRSPTFAALFEQEPNGIPRLEIAERLGVANALIAYLYHGDYREAASNAIIPYSLHLRMFDQAHLFGVEGLAELAFDYLRGKAEQFKGPCWPYSTSAHITDDLLDGLKAMYELKSDEDLIRPIKDELLQVTALHSGRLRLAENKRFQKLVLNIPTFYNDLYAMEGFVLSRMFDGNNHDFESNVIASVTDVFQWIPDTRKKDSAGPSALTGEDFVETTPSDTSMKPETMEKIAELHANFDQPDAEDVKAMEAILLERRPPSRKRQNPHTTSKDWQIVQRPKPVLHFDDADPEEATTSAFDPFSTTETETEADGETDTEQSHGFRKEISYNWHSIETSESQGERSLVLRPLKRRHLIPDSDTEDTGNEADENEWTLLT